MIMLSKLSFSPNIEMFLSFISFWNTAINAFVIPFRIMLPSLFDVAVMLSLPIVGEGIPTLYNEDFEELSYPVSKENSSYGKYMEIHQRTHGRVSKNWTPRFSFLLALQIIPLQ